MSLDTRGVQIANGSKNPDDEQFKSQIFSARYLRRFCEDRTVQRRADHGDLKQAESGVPVSELCQEHGMSNTSFYEWRAKFGGMDASMVS